MSRAPRRASAQARRRLRWRRWAAGLAFAAAGGVPLASFAEPTETQPAAVASDPDYAAGKQALDRKDWGEAALELNPRHRGAHGYAGETYLMVGDLASAEEHPAAPRRICVLPCEELGDLEREIAAYRTRARPL